MLRSTKSQMHYRVWGPSSSVSLSRGVGQPELVAFEGIKADISISCIIGAGCWVHSLLPCML